MVLAVFALMVVTLLGLAVLQRAALDVRVSGRMADGAAASAGAEQGVAHALALITADGQTDVAGSGDLPDGTYRFESNRRGPDEIVVYSEATIDQSRRAVEVVLELQAVTGPEVLFVDQSADFADNSGSIIGRVGTNGTIDGASPGDAQDLHGPAASCATCTNITTFDEARPVVFPELVPATSNDCPRNRKFRRVVSGNGGLPIVCSNAPGRPLISFVGEITIVSPPLIIYVGDDFDVEFDNAVINAGGPSSDFQLVLVGEGNAGRIDVVDSRVGGTIEAPGWSAEIDGFSLVGSAAFGSLAVTPGSSLSIVPASDAASPTSQDWVVSGWQQVPPR